MQIYPHLYFNGQCREAFEFYETCLRGKINLMMTYGDAPGIEHPPDWHGKIVHATFVVDGHRFSGADVPREQAAKPRGYALQLNLTDATEADRIFKTLAEHGAVQMPLQETFWALRFGMLVDRFDIPWEINCEIPAREAS